MVNQKSMLVYGGWNANGPLNDVILFDTGIFQYSLVTFKLSSSQLQSMLCVKLVQFERSTLILQIPKVGIS